MRRHHKSRHLTEFAYQAGHIDVFYSKNKLARCAQQSEVSLYSCKIKRVRVNGEKFLVEQDKRQ